MIRQLDQGACYRCQREMWLYQTTDAPRPLCGGCLAPWVNRSKGTTWAVFVVQYPGLGYVEASIERYQDLYRRHNAATSEKRREARMDGYIFKRGENKMAA